MKNNRITFRMAARCEAAGRPNNEDNYQLDEDLSDDRWGFTADREIELGGKGALLLVCDGMGGMNAGEVASAIAVATIKQLFEADQLTDGVLNNPTEYVGKAIKSADAAIKKHCKEHPETEGMGSTIVLAWLLKGKVHVGWCGDSRCYCYNPVNGLVRLSHDHSYVQELVDAGKLTEELAFDHPNNNIITRSLGDPNGTAKPDVKSYDLHDNDIIMLCSDGLCGCLRDNEIEEQISGHLGSMQECRDALWNADEAAGWHDNVTIAMAQILSGAGKAVAVTSDSSISASKAKLIANNKLLKIVLILLVALIVIAGCGVAYWFLKPEKKPKEEKIVEEEVVKEAAKEETVENVDEKTQEAEREKTNPEVKPGNKVKSQKDTTTKTIKDVIKSSLAKNDTAENEKVSSQQDVNPDTVSKTFVGNKGGIGK